jgi:hypothetical protein
MMWRPGGGGGRAYNARTGLTKQDIMMWSGFYSSKQEHEVRCYEYDNETSRDSLFNWETVIFS